VDIVGTPLCYLCLAVEQSVRSKLDHLIRGDDIGSELAQRYISPLQRQNRVDTSHAIEGKRRYGLKPHVALLGKSFVAHGESRKVCKTPTIWRETGTALAGTYSVAFFFRPRMNWRTNGSRAGFPYPCFVPLLSSTTLHLFTSVPSLFSWELYN
jgi:hypothetical protein